MSKLWKKSPTSKLYSERSLSYCLYSIHVDINPGDRQNKCQGLLKPVGIEKFKDTYKIIYECLKCHEHHKNIMAKDDNMDMIIEISKQS